MTTTLDTLRARAEDEVRRRLARWAVRHYKALCDEFGVELWAEDGSVNKRAASLIYAALHGTAPPEDLVQQELGTLLRRIERWDREQPLVPPLEVAQLGEARGPRLPPPEALSAFMAHVGKPTPDGCWPWDGATYRKDGHDYLARFSYDSRMYSVRRSGLFLLEGYTTDDYRLPWLCGSPVCINPAHYKHADRFRRRKDATA